MDVVAEGKRYGSASVVLGPVSGTLDLAYADARYQGEWPEDLFGTVAFAGDMDGDGRDEFWVGAAYRGAAGLGSGAAYLFTWP